MKSLRRAWLHWRFRRAMQKYTPITDPLVYTVIDHLEAAGYEVGETR